MSLVVSVVGRSNSGKTTLLEKLIVELKKRGYTVAAVKHSGGDFQLDHPGKDSWRLTEAGSDAVVLASPHKIAFMERPSRPLTLEGAVRLLGNRFDFVLVEGFKEKGSACRRSGIPRIEVHRKELGGLVSTPEELFAVVSDEDLGIPVPSFSSSDGVALADLLVQRLKDSSACCADTRRETGRSREGEG
jgi:molybdopterin-guanine dinucleotide biosynthesis adapter protein